MQRRTEKISFLIVSQSFSSNLAIHISENWLSSQNFSYFFFNRGIVSLCISVAFFTIQYTIWYYISFSFVIKNLIIKMLIEVLWIYQFTDLKIGFITWVFQYWVLYSVDSQLIYQLFFLLAHLLWLMHFPLTSSMIEILNRDCISIHSLSQSQCSCFSTIFRLFLCRFFWL